MNCIMCLLAVLCIAGCAADRSALQKREIRVYYRADDPAAREAFDNNGNVIKLEGVIPDGIIWEYYPDGALRTKWQYEQGKREGEKREFYPGGALKGIWQYKDNELDGLCKTFYENGTVKSVWNNSAGKRHGIGKTYYENRQVSMAVKFADDKRDGVSASYYEDGTVQALWRYRNGLLNGISRMYYKNGRIETELKFKNGDLDGISKKYFSDGGIAEQACFERNELQGVTKVFYPRGGVARADTYKNNKKRLSLLYDEKGAMVSREEFPEGTDTSRESLVSIEELSDVLRTAFDATGGCAVLEKFTMERMLTEYPVKLGNAVSLAAAVEVGTLLEVDFLVAGWITSLHDMNMMNVCVISVGEKSILCEEMGRCNTREELKDTAHHIASEVVWKLLDVDVFAQRPVLGVVDFNFSH